MQRTELQELAYKTIPNNEKKTRLTKTYAVVNNLIKKIHIGKGENYKELYLGSWYLRKLDTIKYPGCSKYGPQDVWLGYMGKEHYLLISKKKHGIGRGELGDIFKELYILGYGVKLNALDNMSVPEVLHFHVWK